MEARDLSLSSTIYYLNTSTGNSGETNPQSIILKDNLIEIYDGLNTHRLNPELKEFGRNEVQYYLNQIDWFRAILPYQEKRVSKLENELLGAKGFLNEIKKKLQSA